MSQDVLNLQSLAVSLSKNQIKQKKKYRLIASISQFSSLVLIKFNYDHVTIRVQLNNHLSKLCTTQANLELKFYEKSKP